LIHDYTGDKYVWNLYGVEKPEKSLVQLDEGYAYGDAENERDIEAGYPHDHKAASELSDTVQDYIYGNGAFKNPFDLKAEYDYALEKNLTETA